MKLLIKQRVFSWRDSYDIYDEDDNKKYTVKAEFISLGHRLHVYDTYGNEIGMIKQRLLTLLPTFDIEMNGMTMGSIKKKFTLFFSKYYVDFKGWTVEGNFLGWNYDVYDRSRTIAHITKELLHWGDTYVVDIIEPENELMALMLVIAIDAANCSND